MTAKDWLKPSTWLVFLLGIYMLVNTVRVVIDPVGFASYMGLPLADPRDTAFVHVYALRAAFLGLCALALLWRGDMRALSVFATVALVMPLGDATLTALHGAPPLTVARHAATAIALAITAYLLHNRARKEAKA